MTDWDRDVYLPDDALAKVDRASMASSLETRAPFLDYRVVELAYTMPDELKLRHSASKWIVRQLLYTLVPRALVNRGKRGFSAPTAAWLAGPLRDWAAHLIAESSSYAHILDHHAIKVCWRKFESGHRHLNGEIWSATIMLAWLSSFESVAVGQTGHHQLLFA
jgi:asparagine synthase (glutamine-hydrolysing)